MDLGRSRRVFTSTLVTATLSLAAWTAYLAATLPRHYVASHWNLAWVGLDTTEVIALLATAWAAWRRRVVVILFAITAATLFLLDGWFDVTTARQHDLFSSLVVALVVELPGAVVLLLLARRVVRLVTGEWYRVAFQRDAPPPWRLSLDDLDRRENR